MASTKDIVLPVAPRDPDFTRGSIFFVGTATVLLRYAGFTILTDPNFLHQGDYAKLGYGLRSRRHTEPALDIDQLPRLDLVVLSHMHDDHFDHIAARRLNKNLPIVSTHHAAVALEKLGFRRTYALKTWAAKTFVKGGARLRITSMPGEHGPGIVSKLLPPVMGSMLDFIDPAGAVRLRLYITGDTLVHDDLREIPRRFPGIDLALLHLGGTKVLGVMLTMDGKQGVEALRIVAPELAIPIHYDDYTVFKSPLSDFAREVRVAGLEQKVRYIGHGETYEFEVPSSLPQVPPLLESAAVELPNLPALLEDQSAPPDLA